MCISIKSNPQERKNLMFLYSTAPYKQNICSLCPPIASRSALLWIEVTYHFQLILYPSARVANYNLVLSGRLIAVFISLLLIKQHTKHSFEHFFRDSCTSSICLASFISGAHGTPCLTSCKHNREYPEREKNMNLYISEFFIYYYISIINPIEMGVTFSEFRGTFYSIWSAKYDRIDQT